MCTVPWEMLLQFKKEGVGEESSSSSSSSSSPRAARGGRPQLDQLSSSSAGATDRLIQPGDKERDGDDNAGQRRWAGALERSRLSGVRWQAEPGRRCTGAVQITISDHGLFSFQQAAVTSHTCFSLFLFSYKPLYFPCMYNNQPPCQKEQDGVLKPGHS